MATFTHQPRKMVESRNEHGARIVTWVADGPPLSFEVALSINEEKLTRLFAHRVMRNGDHKATLAGGAIVARAVNIRPAQ